VGNAGTKEMAKKCDKIPSLRHEKKGSSKKEWQNNKFSGPGTPAEAIPGARGAVLKRLGKKNKKENQTERFYAPLPSFFG